MNNSPNQTPKQKKNKVFAILPYILIPLMMVIGIAIASQQSGNRSAEAKYYQIVQYFDKNQVSEFTLNLTSGTLKYKLKGDDTKWQYKVPNVSVFVDDINETVREHNKNAKSEDDMIKYELISGSSTSWFVNLLPTIIMGVLLVILLVIMMRRMNTMGGDMNKTLNFGKINAKKQQDQKSKTTFEQVAGADEEKEELSEMVDFLKCPEKFSTLGARIPKGVLLVGPPGTGKTLLARAIAGEANVPFFSISGSDFVEMYVGVGASRVRDLFDQAKKDAPSVIFIDEIDAVGRHRGAGMGGGHDEREQTLNQLLVEMDGFEKNQGVIVIAATNRPDILDPALLRPGRFDRQVRVGYPDTKGREAILKVHSAKKPLANDVDLEEIAKATAGYSGADLENLMNESAIFAARRNHLEITRKDIEDANLKVMMGTEKRSRIITEKEKKLTAFHEAGHAVLAKLVDKTSHIHKVSIIPRGRAGGYTMYVPDEDKMYTSKNEMLDRIIVMLGGRVAEELTMDDISTGASSDIQRATDIARQMVTKYGMSEAIGPVSYDDGGEVFIGRDFAHSKAYSEKTAADIDAEVKHIMTLQYRKTEQILTENMAVLTRVAEKLLEKETIDGQEFEECFNI